MILFDRVLSDRVGIQDEEGVGPILSSLSLGCPLVFENSDWERSRPLGLHAVFIISVPVTLDSP